MTRRKWWTNRAETIALARRDTQVKPEDSPVRPGINAQTPNSMPRGEDDDQTRAHSPEFHDRPGSGRYTSERQTYF